MFRKLVSFEWKYQTKGVLFYVIFFAFMFLGFFAAAIGNFSFPGMNRNSPYMITDLIGLISLAAIFTSTILVAQNFLRENDTRMDTLIYSTQVSKLNFLGSRLVGGVIINSTLFTAVVLGMIFGHQMPWLLQDEIGPFRLIDYGWPLIILGIPNVIFCTSVLASLAWISRNKLIIYIGGLTIFILYLVGAAISNSPLLAGASPASPEAMSLAAKFDPFGMAAFFEQTRYWTALERNTSLIDLEGNFLLNRILLILISFVLCLISYKFFDFRKKSQKVEKKIKQPLQKKYIPLNIKVSLEIQNIRHNLAVFFSFIKIDVKAVLKGIPFILIILILSAFLIIQFINAIDGGTRMPESIADTGIIINVFTEVLPTFIMIVLLFYSAEVFRRSETYLMSMLENAAPTSGLSIFYSKIFTISLIPVIIITFSILLGILFQSFKGDSVIEFLLYMSMYYLIGFPMILIGILFLCLQSVFRNKYAATALSLILILLVGTSIGKALGIEHPLFRFGNVLNVPYFQMNGFNGYITSFHFQMLYNIGFCIILVLLTTTALNFKSIFQAKNRFLMTAGILLWLGTGSFIFYNTNINGDYKSDSGMLQWKIEYEKQFRKYENLTLPTVLTVTTKVDLYPETNSYEVEGSYTLVNKFEQPIDSILIYMDKATQLKSLSLENSILTDNSSKFGHYWYKLESPLKIGDTISMQFAFSSSWLPFTNHTPFNSIINNGSFIRMSRYFPRFGYQPENETGLDTERSKHKLGKVTSLKNLDAPDTFFNYDFITLNSIVSTSDQQIAIGSGELVKKWKSDGRNYFHYVASQPIPFRFAFSSAKYNVKTENYKGIDIEIYYDKRHSRNVDALLSNTKLTLDYCQDNFGNYPFSTIRYAEISSFAEGFSATAYPEVIFVKENSGFNGNLTQGNKEDVINQLAGHELSHQWWATQISPEVKEGGWLLTEMLAKYTELMIYKKVHGEDEMLDIVAFNLDAYLSNRAFTEETPLYKTSYDTPHLPYNKGMVVMHQLRMLLGEEMVNKALRSLLSKYAYPKNPPDSHDLIREFYAVASPDSHSKIDEMFKRIITYSSKIESAEIDQNATGYKVNFTVKSNKYEENGKGKQVLIANDDNMEIAFFFGDGSSISKTYPIENNKIVGSFLTRVKPVKMVIDPPMRTIDIFKADNEKLF